MISAKQLDANRRNAQKSTGPRTPEGKATVSLNALQHGLRARRTVLPGENDEAFAQLCADLEAEWQPSTPTERALVEQMATTQWILARLAGREAEAFARFMAVDLLGDFAQKLLPLLERFSAQKARLERSFSRTLHDLEHLQQRRPESTKPPAKPKPAPSAEPQPHGRPESSPAPDISYVMTAPGTGTR